MSANINPNSLFTGTDVVPTYSSFTLLGVVIVVIILVVGGVVAYHYYQLHESPWWDQRAKANSFIWDWLDRFRDSPSLGALGNLNDVPSPVQLSAPPPPPSPTPMASPSPPPVAWCFIGEDLTGRYCVKVPSAASCDRTRVFNSQQDCELQMGNAMPAGVVSPHDGRVKSPLSSALLAP